LDVTQPTATPALYPLRREPWQTPWAVLAELAEKTGLSRETLYRTLSQKGNPRLDTLAAFLPFLACVRLWSRREPLLR